MEVDYDYKDDKFIIRNFNRSTPFHNFLPGISGMFGIPMWVFYTNRGQVITSFGIGNKDNAILEFRPADQAINVVSSFGFRTFIKVDEIMYEPFQQNTLNSHYLEISPYKLKIIEINEILNLSVEIEYCTMNSNDFPGLIRKVKIINKGEITHVTQTTLNYELWTDKTVLPSIEALEDNFAASTIDVELAKP